MAKVLMLGPMPPLVGGMASVLDNLSKSNIKHTHDLVFFDTGKQSSEQSNIFWRVFSHICQIMKLIWILLRFRPKILHIHTCSGLTFFIDGLYANLGRLLGAKYILHIHGGRFISFIEAQSGIASFFAKIILHKAAVIVALSDKLKAAFYEKLSVKRVVTIVNGVPAPVNEPLDKHKRKSDASEVSKILFLGAITKNKGILDLIDAVAMLNEDFHLYIAGNFCADISSQKLNEKIKSHAGLANKISVLGVVQGQQKSKLLQECDIFCLPSYVEGLPMSVLEAMSYQQAVLVSNVGGLPDLINNHENGLLIEAGNTNHIADGLSLLLSDTELRVKLAKAGNQSFLKEYSMDAIMNQYTILYQQVMRP